MKKIKLVARAIIAITLFPLYFVILFASISLLGLVLLLSFMGILGSFISFLSDNKDWKEDLIDSVEMFIFPFIAPFFVCYEYIIYGTVNIMG